jgi:hypothetical protein
MSTVIRNAMYTATKAVIRANRALKTRALAKAIQIEAHEAAQNRTMWTQLKQSINSSSSSSSSSS